MVESRLMRKMREESRFTGTPGPCEGAGHHLPPRSPSHTPVTVTHRSPSPTPVTVTPRSPTPTPVTVAPRSPRSLGFGRQPKGHKEPSAGAPLPLCPLVAQLPIKLNLTRAEDKKGPNSWLLTWPRASGLSNRMCPGPHLTCTAIRPP